MENKLKKKHCPYCGSEYVTETYDENNIITCICENCDYVDLEYALEKIKLDFTNYENYRSDYLNALIDEIDSIIYHKEDTNKIVKR